MKEMALKNPGNPYTYGFKDKELVILNTEITVGGKKRGFYDEVIKVIPDAQLKKLGIHVMNTVDEAVEKMKELNDKKMARLAAEGHSKLPAKGPSSAGVRV
jgi:hypothetical protein